MRKTMGYASELKKLQVELLKLQRHVKKHGLRILTIFEGRDAAGKGGTIKRFVEHLNPRGARIVALEKPSDREQTEWYFQRYVSHLPSAGEMVFFDRSWYNRAMVEPVMGFCTDEEHKKFLKYVPDFELLLVNDGILLFKYYFSVSKQEQNDRFKARETDLLKQYKLSPVDLESQEMWNEYSIRKFEMLTNTNRTATPWTIIRSDNKKRARINCIKHFLTHIEYEERIPVSELESESEIIISGIDEITLMEKGLMDMSSLPG